MIQNNSGSPESEDFRPIGKPVEEENHGERVDLYLANHFPFLSRKGWQNKIKSGELKINGLTTKVSYRIKEQDQVTLFHPNVREPEVDKGIAPIWKQGNILGVYKPANLPMHENGPYRKNTFYELLRNKIGPNWAAIHRLDRETSGIVLCANSSPLRKKLAEMFEQRKVNKEYLAICQGVSKKDRWLEEGSIGDLKDSKIRIKKWVVEDGQPSATLFQVLDRTENHTLVKCYPKTGRTNQIRIHLAFGGLPIVGDKLYHPDEEVFLDFFENGPSKEVDLKTGFNRLCLHACFLAFENPEDYSFSSISSPLPSELESLWSKYKSKDELKK